MFEDTKTLSAPPDRPLRLWIEPWAESHTFPPGTVVTLRAHASQEGHLELATADGTTSVWGWPGSTLEVLVEGKPILSFDQPVPAIPDGLSTRDFVGTIFGPPTAAPTPGRHRVGGGWDGPYESVPGPRPPLAFLAAWIYVLTGIFLLSFGIVSTVIDWRTAGLEEIEFCLPIALYCAALAYGALRLRSRSAGVRASRWICAPLLLHGLCGFLGATLPLTYVVGLESRWFKQIASDAALAGMLLGWLPALSPFVFARRAGALLVATISGPVVLFVAVQFIHIHI